MHKTVYINRLLWACVEINNDKSLTIFFPEGWEEFTDDHNYPLTLDEALYCGFAKMTAEEAGFKLKMLAD